MKYKYYILSTANDYYMADAVCRELEKSGAPCYYNQRDSNNKESLPDDSFKLDDNVVVIAIANDEFIANPMFSSPINTFSNSKSVCKDIIILQNEPISNYPPKWENVISIDASKGLTPEIMSILKGDTEPAVSAQDISNADELKIIKNTPQYEAQSNALSLTEQNCDETDESSETFEYDNQALTIKFSELLISDDSTPIKIKRAIRYFNGDGVPEDINRAYSIISKAFDENPCDPYTSYYYGLCKEFGLGTETSLEIAEKAYRKANDAGFEPAAIRLALVRYCSGKDIVLAKKFFKKISEDGNLDGTFMLGHIAEDEGNFEEALDFYAEAAENGYAKAQNAVGCMYAAGKGIDKSEDAAMQWFTLAANQEYPSALYNMGLLLIQKEGVIDDESIEYLRSAADLGHISSQEIIEEVERMQAEEKKKEELRNRQRQRQNNNSSKSEDVSFGSILADIVPELLGYAKERLIDGK